MRVSRETSVRLTLPWRALAPDNGRLTPVATRKGWKRMILSAEYRRAKKLAQGLIATQYRGRPLEGPVALTARIYVPNANVRDVTNYAKAIGDALKGTVLVDDRWQVLRSTTWTVPGIDRDRPRAELMIEPWEEVVPMPG